MVSEEDNRIEEKALDWLSATMETPLVSSVITNQELSSATKIIESFVNPILEHGKIIAEVENLSETLHTPIRIVKDLKEISDSDKQLEKRKRGLIVCIGIELNNERRIYNCTFGIKDQERFVPL